MSMAGAELLRLQRPADRRTRERRTHALTPVPVNHVDSLRREAHRGVDHVLEQCSARERLQHLR